jgi:hypothetical protein
VAGVSNTKRGSTKNSKPSNGGLRRFPRRRLLESKLLILTFLEELLGDSVRELQSEHEPGKKKLEPQPKSSIN